MRGAIVSSVTFASLACLLQAAGLAAPGSRDWTKYPAVIERHAPATVYAIGDIHGDYARLVRLLVAARIIPAPPKPSDVAWNAGHSVLVVTGDMIDKGPRPVDLLRLLIALRIAARQAHGEVILLAGNHEAAFLAGADEKKADFIADLKKNGYMPSQVAACQGDLGQFLCSLPFAARVGDWFFAHAGNTGGRTIAQIAAEIRADVDQHGFGARQLTDPNSLLEARLGESNTWFVAPSAYAEQQLLASYAKALGVKHIVQGHQHNDVQFADGVSRNTGEMFQRWGLLFLIDVGMSEGVGDSYGAVLRIKDTGASAICADGARTVLWNDHANRDIGRVAPCAQ